jgi:hypothetical protein
MPRGVQWVLGIALAVVLTLGLAVGATVSAAIGEGTISVHVQPPGGGDIHVAVPAAAANLAIAAVDLAPGGSWVADEVPREAVEALDRYMPVAQEAIDALAAQPDFVIVEVDSADEHVLIQKRGRRILVLVDGDEGRIEVSLPLSTVKELGKALRRLSRVS